MATDNGDFSGKLLVRKHLMQSLAKPHAELRVLETFAGMGHIHDAIYQGVGAHLGIEKRKVNRPTWVQGNSYVLLPHYLNQQWDLIDVDAYDNPWLLANHVARLREPGRFAMACTCGIRRGLKNAKSNGFVKQVTGMNQLSDVRLAARWYDDVIRWSIARWATYGVKVIEAVRIKSNANLAGDVWYWGFLVEKQPLTVIP